MNSFYFLQWQFMSTVKKFYKIENEPPSWKDSLEEKWVLIWIQDLKDYWRLKMYSIIKKHRPIKFEGEDNYNYRLYKSINITKCNV